LSEPLTSHQDNPACFLVKDEYAQVSSVVITIAQKFLVPAPTSVPSERLFSIAGDLYLTTAVIFYPKMHETLILLKFNISVKSFNVGVTHFTYSSSDFSFY